MNTCGTCYFYDPCTSPICPADKPAHGFCFAEPPVNIVKVDDSHFADDEYPSMFTGPGEVLADRRCCRHWRPRDVN